MPMRAPIAMVVAAQSPLERQRPASLCTMNNPKDSCKCHSLPPENRKKKIIDYLTQYEGFLWNQRQTETRRLPSCELIVSVKRAEVNWAGTLRLLHSLLLLIAIYVENTCCRISHSMHHLHRVSLDPRSMPKSHIAASTLRRPPNRMSPLDHYEVPPHPLASLCYDPIW